MIDVAEVTVRYGRQVAVDRVSLHVAEGECVGVIGVNGAGKSSLLRAIAGAVRPVSGEIAFMGESLIGRPLERVAGCGIALVPEGRRVFTRLTVEENLILGAAGRPWSEVEHELDRQRERFPSLVRRWRTGAGGLSGGEAQQLAIARALMSRPRLLMLDEPSLGLAPIVVDQVFQLLDELRRDRMTILLVEQNAVRTIEFADRSYLLGRGQVLVSGTAERFQAEPEFQSRYLGLEVS